MPLNAISPKDGRPLSLQDAFIRRTRLDRAVLRDANLARADMTGVSAKHADFQNAILEGTILKGADLRGAKNLTPAQLSQAIIDDATRLPHHITREAIYAAAKNRENG